MRDKLASPLRPPHRLSRGKQLVYLLAGIVLIYLLVVNPSEESNDSSSPSEWAQHEGATVNSPLYLEMSEGLIGSQQTSTNEIIAAMLSESNTPGQIFVRAAREFIKKSEIETAELATTVAEAVAAFVGASKSLQPPIKTKEWSRRIRVHRNVYRLFSAAQEAKWPRPLLRKLSSAVANVEQLTYPWFKTSLENMEAAVRKNQLPPILQTGQPAPLVAEKFQPRGLVYTTGKSHAKYTYLSILNVREVGCKLPITIMYGGDDDLPEAYRTVLEALPNVNTMNVLPYFDESIVQTGGWAIKPYTLLYAPYREVMFIDSDVYWFQAPDSLFQTAQYNATGTLFFHDRTLFPDQNSPSHKWFQSLVQYPSAKARSLRHWKSTSQHEQESGVVVIDRSRALLPMAAVCALNTRETRDGEVYHEVHGDKETFWMGFEMAREAYSFLPGFGSVVGFQSSEHGVPFDKTVCGGLLHADEKDRPIWFNGGVQVDKYWQPNRMVSFESMILDKDAVNVEWRFGEDSHDGFCLTKAQGKAIDLQPADRATGSWLVEQWQSLPNRPELKDFWTASL